MAKRFRGGKVEMMEEKREGGMKSKIGETNSEERERKQDDDKREIEWRETK